MLAPVLTVGTILKAFNMSCWLSAPSFQTTNPQTQRTPELDFAQSLRQCAHCKHSGRAVGTRAGQRSAGGAHAGLLGEYWGTEGLLTDRWGPLSTFLHLFGLGPPQQAPAPWLSWALVQG